MNRASSVQARLAVNGASLSLSPSTPPRRQTFIPFVLRRKHPSFAGSLKLVSLQKLSSDLYHATDGLFKGTVKGYKL
jgi:hypothetical protein